MIVSRRASRWLAQSPCFQLVGRELHVDGHDVLAGGGERGVVKGGNGNVEIGRGGKFAVFGMVEGALEIIDAGADVDAAGERRRRHRRRWNFSSAVKFGRRVEREIQFGGSALAR